MKKTGASMMFLALMIVVLTTFAVMANAQLRSGTNVPANTGFAAQGQFPQGMQTGALGQGQAGGLAGGVLNQPGVINPGQQQGAGIWIGEGDIRPTGTLPGGTPGGPTCQCIAAPCNCPPSTGSLPKGPILDQAGQPPIPGLPGQQSGPGGIPFNPGFATQSGAVQPAGTGQLIKR
jgi:hypothetical protein